MSPSETILFLGLPIVSFTIGWVLGWWAIRRQRSVPRAQMTAAGVCFLGLLVLFFCIELQAAIAADRALGAAMQSAATTAGVLALACLPLAPIPAFIVRSFGARFATPRQDDVDG